MGKSPVLVGLVAIVAFVLAMTLFRNIWYAVRVSPFVFGVLLVGVFLLGAYLGGKR